MKLLKSFIVALSFIGVGYANAGTLKCTSVGEKLPANRLNFEVTLQTTLSGNVVQSGTYSYKGTGSIETGSGEFACLRPDDKGVVRCGAIRPDLNILSIVVHPVLGLTLQIGGQQYLVLFDCK